jgi:micrococcal nuclease
MPRVSKPARPAPREARAVRSHRRITRAPGLWVVATFLGLASPAWAAATLHFTFGVSRQVDACWEAGDRLRYRVGVQTYEVARADVARIDGVCGQPGETAAAPSASPPAPAEARPTDAMLAAGRAIVPAPSWSPVSLGGCRARGIKATLHQVIDGDTIEVRMPDGHAEVVRYIGVNAPEVHRPDSVEESGGLAAKGLNEALLKGKRLELTFDMRSRDRHGRLLAYVYADGEHVNALLVERGYAAAAGYPPNVCFADRFLSLERQARDARRGLWAEADPGAALLAARKVNVLADVGHPEPGRPGASGKR